jgi:uncharacterized membrane protein
MEIPTKRLIAGFILIFILGVMFAVVNGFYASDFDSPLPLIVYGISFISLIVGGFIVLLFQWKINKVQLEKAIKLLPEDERKIVKLLFENNGSLEQNKIVALSGLNKVKVSRIISELEFRKAIKKTDLGNTNLVVLNV